MKGNFSANIGGNFSANVTWDNVVDMLKDQMSKEKSETRNQRNYVDPTLLFISKVPDSRHKIAFTHGFRRDG